MTSAAPHSPRSVIRGEIPPLAVSIDYLNFTVPDGNVRELVAECMALLGISEATDEGRGIHGYAARVDLQGYGLVAYGGESQRGTVLVSINGAGCQRIASFHAVRLWGESVGGRVTRLDIAADDHHGEVLDVAGAIEAWRHGQFKVAGAGRSPKANLRDDLGSGDGRTLNVGSRDSGKLCRVYEKGRQLGDKLSRWVRGEVELHNKDRVIPWDALSEPARYIAGAFPYFACLSLAAERIKTIKKATAITLAQLQGWVRSAAGKAINALLIHSGGDIGEVLLSVRRDGVPKRLNDLWQAGARLSLQVPHGCS